MIDYDFTIYGTQVTLATNKAGDGLFIWNYNHYRQLIGTCDFTTRNVKNPRAKVYRRYRKMMDETVKALYDYIPAPVPLEYGDF